MDINMLIVLLIFLVYLATLVTLVILDPKRFSFKRIKESNKAKEETCATLYNDKKE